MVSSKNLLETTINLICVIMLKTNENIHTYAVRVLGQRLEMYKKQQLYLRAPIFTHGKYPYCGFNPEWNLSQHLSSKITSW